LLPIQRRMLIYLQELLVSLFNFLRIKNININLKINNYSLTPVSEDRSVVSDFSEVKVSLSAEVTIVIVKMSINIVSESKI